jgi:hypothetical protein
MAGGHYVLRALRAVVVTRTVFWRITAHRLADRWQTWPPLL